MQTTSRATNQDVMFGPSTRSRSRHTLLAQMARDAEKLAAQAERLRALKEISRVKFKAISAAVGVTERQVQRWFAGDSDIEPDNLKALARFLGTTPDFIEYGEIGRGPTPNLLKAASQLNRIEGKLDEILERLPTPEDKTTEEAAEELEALPGRLSESAVAPKRRASARSAKKRGAGPRKSA